MVEFRIVCCNTYHNNFAFDLYLVPSSWQFCLKFRCFGYGWEKCSFSLVRICLIMLLIYAAGFSEPMLCLQKVVFFCCILLCKMATYLHLTSCLYCFCRHLTLRICTCVFYCSSSACKLTLLQCIERIWLVSWSGFCSILPQSLQPLGNLRKVEMGATCTNLVLLPLRATRDYLWFFYDTSYT